jgi:diphthamide synthase (EF-2-diphthine--ammonia ligase)
MRLAALVSGGKDSLYEEALRKLEFLVVSDILNGLNQL